jgi:two-component system osmolarity sensor histidine kinase EnvZ
MKRRVERAVEQRTAMLNGVSHDLRTILTRFRLSLAVMDEQPETEPLQNDVQEMQRMLEGYLAFARGDAGEPTVMTDLHEVLDALRCDAERQGGSLSVETNGDLKVKVRPSAFKRCLGNLVANAQRHARNIVLQASREQRFIAIHVDDDGPGIAPEHREEVFRPFYRLDEARNQDESGAGLGLAIARDIARSHGGDVSLGTSAMGGLRASVRIPL